jgi:chloramphenicol-sensitive protein RarD
MESSLGYFINPLLNMIIAIIFLKERMSKFGIIACLLAFCGVMVITLQAGVAPWISLILALTFSFYGLMKKRIPVQSYTSITIETMLATPVALTYLLFFSHSPVIDLRLGLYMNVFLILSGVVTATPLLLFAEATRRISYITVGFTQYVSPTTSFLIAYFLYGESLPPLKLVGFVFIWIGILVYSADSFRSLRKGTVHAITEDQAENKS